MLASCCRPACRTDLTSGVESIKTKDPITGGKTPSPTFRAESSSACCGYALTLSVFPGDDLSLCHHVTLATANQSKSFVKSVRSGFWFGSPPLHCPRHDCSWQYLGFFSSLNAISFHFIYPSRGGTPVSLVFAARYHASKSYRSFSMSMPSEGCLHPHRCLDGIQSAIGSFLPAVH
jgi:hypothetical protein